MVRWPIRSKVERFSLLELSFFSYIFTFPLCWQCFESSGTFGDMESIVVVHSISRSTERAPPLKPRKNSIEISRRAPEPELSSTQSFVAAYHLAPALTPSPATKNLSRCGVGKFEHMG